MSDIAVYSKKEAQPTSGAGAIAILIGPNPVLCIDPIRASHFMNAYDFYKPELSHDYPTVNGKFSTDIYIKSFILSWKRFKQRTGKSLNDFEYFCLHCPFTKQVRKSFIGLIFNEMKSDPEFLIEFNLSDEDKKIYENFLSSDTLFYNRKLQAFLIKITSKLVKNKLEQGLYIPSCIGNIYTGSLYLSLISLIYSFENNQKNLKNKNILIYSYGSGLASSILSLTIKNPNRFSELIDYKRIKDDLNHNKYYSCEDYFKIQKENEKYFAGKNFITKFDSNNINKTEVPELNNDAFFLKNVDQEYIRNYVLVDGEGNISDFNQVKTNSLSSFKISNKKVKKLRDLSISERQTRIGDKYQIPGLIENLKSGGLTEISADNMTENCVGKIGMPLSLIENLSLNGKLYSVPMSTEEASVVAAANRSTKLIREAGGGFWGRNTRNVIRGQIYIVDFSGMSQTEFVNRDHGSEYYYSGKNLLKGTENREGIVDFNLQTIDSLGSSSETIPQLQMESGIDSVTYLKDFNSINNNNIQVIYLFSIFKHKWIYIY